MRLVVICFKEMLMIMIRQGQAGASSLSLVNFGILWRDNVREGLNY